MRVFSLFLLLILWGCKQSLHKVVDTYPNGQAKTEYTYPDKIDTSTYSCVVYYENGLPQYKTEIEDGMFVGQKITYYADGSVKRIEELLRPTPVNDSLYDCRITNFRTDGTKESTYTYVSNQLTGLATNYDSTGQVSRTAEYQNGRMNGKETLYYGNGRARSTAFVTNDTLRGYHIDFKENGDTLKWYNNSEYGADGVFYKKWLDNGLILAGTYGDTERSYVVWKWMDKSGKLVRTKVDRSGREEYIAPE